MALQSMTGFARSGGEVAGLVFAWEAKSVNGKGLETRLRLPAGFERIEQSARAAIQKRFSRGNLQIVLSVNRTSGQSVPVVNDALLGELAALARKLADDYGMAPASADGLLAIRGVLDFPEIGESDEERAEIDAALQDGLATALEELEAARRQEGAALVPVMARHIDAIEALTLEAEADPSRDPQTIRARLAAQVELLLGASPPLDEGRLYAEAAFLATKADIREEIDRLKTHVASARELVAADGPVGRKLDFLAQEFNRESNTLCSKSNAATVTAIGLKLKAVVDQFREQVQNIE
ncbi:MAG: YicC family protein [Notoacmeibacter sp.]|nr:YicC family protein [Notoacmeibacter sp.]